MLLHLRKTLLITVLLTLFALALAGCGAAPASSASVKIETNPNPAKVGDVQLVLNITDQNGGLIPGAKVDVSASHPDMNGMSMGGQAVEKDGKYAIKANFNMAGNWTITVSVHKDGLDVKQELPLVIQ